VAKLDQKDKISGFNDKKSSYKCFYEVKVYPIGANLDLQKSSSGKEVLIVEI